jgi:hypothetical protein
MTSNKVLFISMAVVVMAALMTVAATRSVQISRVVGLSPAGVLTAVCGVFAILAGVLFFTFVSRFKA